MKLIPRPGWRTRLKRIIAAVCVVTGFAALAIETTLHAPIWFYVAPFLAFACGLDYLRATGRRR